MNIIGIIPARMGSSRFPGKPLKEICGIPLVGHVYHRCKMSKVLKEVYIATPDEEIAEYARSIGAIPVMTKDTHERASDRTAEAVEHIEAESGEKVDVVVMIQGDEPMLVPEMIDLAVEPFKKDPTTEVVNLMSPILTDEEHADPNCPKVVVDKEHYALYFSREPIPSKKKWKGETIPRYKQVCVIPFRRDFLAMYTAWAPTPLEEVESIDMNRVLEYGHKVKMVYEEYETYPVDTPADRDKVETYLEKDPLVETYRK